MIRAGARHYSVPAAVAPYVRLVGNVMRLPALDGMRLVPGDAAGAAPPAGWPQDCKPASCGRFVTPGVLAARYAFPRNSSGTKGSISVSEYQGQPVQVSRNT